MQKPVFDTRELVTASWRIFCDHFTVLFFGHLLVNLIVSMVGGPILMGPLGYGMCLAALFAARGRPVKIDLFFAGFSHFLETFLAGILMTLMAMGAAALLALPGLMAVIWAFSTHSTLIFSMTFGVVGTMCLLPVCAVAFFYTPAFFFFHDGARTALEAMAASRRMVWNNARQWLALWAALSLLHVAGLLLCCVGIYVVTPWMMVALAMAYDRERQAVNGGPPDLPQ